MDHSPTQRQTEPEVRGNLAVLQLSMSMESTFVLCLWCVWGRPAWMQALAGAVTAPCLFVDVRTGHQQGPREHTALIFFGPTGEPHFCI